MTPGANRQDQIDVLQESPQAIVDTCNLQIHIPTCPWCGVRATLWEPRMVSGVLLVRLRCWTGHDWSVTAVVPV